MSDENHHSRLLNSVPSHDIYSNNTITMDQLNHQLGHPHHSTTTPLQYADLSAFGGGSNENDGENNIS